MGITIKRRTAVRAVGAALASATLTGRAAAQAEWTTEKTPADGTLYDVAYAGGDASADGNAYAVGQDGVVLERTEERWRKVTDGGRGVSAGVGDVIERPVGRRLFGCPLRLGCRSARESR